MPFVQPLFLSKMAACPSSGKLEQQHGGGLFSLWTKHAEPSARAAVCPHSSEGDTEAGTQGSPVPAPAVWRGTGVSSGPLRAPCARTQAEGCPHCPLPSSVWAGANTRASALEAPL